MCSLGIRDLIDRILSKGTSEDRAETETLAQDKSEALNEFLRRVQNLLAELSARLEGQRWGECTVSDLRQIVLIKCFENLHTFQGTSDAQFGKWLKTVHDNCRKDLIDRAIARRPRDGALVPLVLQDGSRSANGMPEPAADDLSANRQLQLDLALARLAPLDRTIVELRYGMNMKPPEIAARVDLDETTVRRRLKSALKLMQGEVEPPK